MQTCVNYIKQLQEEEDLGTTAMPLHVSNLLSPWILGHGGLLEQQVALVSLALIVDWYVVLGRNRQQRRP